MADRLKNGLLVILLAVMIVLLVLTFLVSVRGGAAGQLLLQSLEDRDGTVAEVSTRAMAQPETLTVMAEEGLYLVCGAQDYDLLYQQVEPLFQEAVGSAGVLQELNEEDYQRAEPARSRSRD